MNIILCDLGERMAGFLKSIEKSGHWYPGPASGIASE